MLTVVRFKVTPVAGTGNSAIDTSAVAVKPPSAVIAVIIALPGDIPLTIPFAFTVATAGLFVLHDTDRLQASLGFIIAVKIPSSPISIVVLV
jgi:hypothetical protein